MFSRPRSQFGPWRALDDRGGPHERVEDLRPLTEAPPAAIAAPSFSFATIPLRSREVSGALDRLAASRSAGTKLDAETKRFLTARFGSPQDAMRAASPSRTAPSLPLQAKLEVGAIVHPLEEEADRVADRVIRMPQPASAISKSTSIAAGATLQRECAECEDEDKLHRKAEGASVPAMTAPSIVHDVVGSPGQPLDPATRAFMEPRFGRNFDHVRVHTDEAAVRSAAAVGAAAYTVGPHIAFAGGRYAPSTDSGRRLLAHELTHVAQQSTGEGILRRACASTFKKASSFMELIVLVREAETRLGAAGITTPKDQIHALRGLFYGTTWSTDFAVETSTMRNEGFQRFTRPSQDPAKSAPSDVTAVLDCGLADALKGSQDLVDASGRHVDFGHLVIGLDARFDPAFASNVKYPVKALFTSVDIDLGGTGTELVTWLGDLGGGAASLAVRRVAAPSTSAGTVFTGSDYGGSINLEGDIAASVVATGSPSAVTAPNLAPGKKFSDVLQDYLSPAAPSASWNDRATTFLTMNGATIDASKTLTNRNALIDSFAKKIQIFACNYLVSRVKDGKIPVATAKAAANDHVISSAREVAAAFVDALDDSRKTGAKIEAKRFPGPTTGGSSACTAQVLAAGLLSP